MLYQIHLTSPGSKWDTPVNPKFWKLKNSLQPAQLCFCALSMLTCFNSGILPNPMFFPGTCTLTQMLTATSWLLMANISGFFQRSLPQHKGSPSPLFRLMQIVSHNIRMGQWPENLSFMPCTCD